MVVGMVPSIGLPLRTNVSKFFKLLQFGPFKFPVKSLSPTSRNDRFGLLKGGIFPFKLEFDTSNTAVKILIEKDSINV
jgi:hypothetical protein